jgi:hypothetical protein
LFSASSEHRYLGGDVSSGHENSHGHSDLGTGRQGRRSIDTLKVSARHHTQGPFAKAMSGGIVKAIPRPPERPPQELKTQEGIGHWKG